MPIDKTDAKFIEELKGIGIQILVKLERDYSSSNLRIKHERIPAPDKVTKLHNYDLLKRGGYWVVGQFEAELLRLIDAYLKAKEQKPDPTPTSTSKTPHRLF